MAVLRRSLLVALAVAAAVAGPAAAEAEPREQPRRRDTGWREIFRGPYYSSRLFVTPVADTVGPYVLALRWDGSLLKEPGVLSSAGVVARKASQYLLGMSCI